MLFKNHFAIDAFYIYTYFAFLITFKVQMWCVYLV